MADNVIKLTAKGLELLAKVQAGATMQFTGAVIGDGILTDNDDVTKFENVLSEVPSHQTGETSSSATVDITRIMCDKETVKLRIKVKNGDKAFYWRELGIKAKADNNEVFYAHVYFGDSASFMPEFDGSTYVTRNIDLTFVVSNADKVNANITLPSEVSYEEFLNHRNATVLDHPNGCVTSEKLADGSVSWLKCDDVIKEKFNELDKAIQKLNSTKKIDLEYSISQGSSGYNFVVKPKVNYITRKEVTGTATYPTQSYDKCYMYICYDYDSDSISLVCGTTVSGRGPQPPDNYIFLAEISSSSDCGDFEYHRLIQKDDDGNAEVVQ